MENRFSEDEWGAYYESEIEKWALHLSEALTKANFTMQEVLRGNHVMFSSSRLEYASNKTKLDVIRNLAGMGIMTVNEAREIMQLAPIAGGDARIVRGEYYLIDDTNRVIAESGGHNGTGEHGVGVVQTSHEWDDLDEPDDLFDDVGDDDLD